MMTSGSLRGLELQEWIESAALNDHDSFCAVLKAAIDASGSHKDAPVMCVAACVATSTQWRLLVDKWSALTGPIVPAGRRYHAKRAPDELSEQLARLLSLRMDKILAVTISAQEYSATAPHRFRSQYGGTYAAATQMILFSLARWSKQSKDRQRISYVFEAGDQGQKHIASLLDAVVATRRMRDLLLIQSYAFLSKDEAILQAPDLVSHVVAKSFGGLSNVMSFLGNKLEHLHMDADMIGTAVAEEHRIRKESDFGVLEDFI